MKIKIENHQENTVRVIEYPLTLLQFVKIHFAAFGFYRIEKTGANVYNVYCKFDGAHIYTVSKAGARDAVTE